MSSKMTVCAVRSLNIVHNIAKFDYWIIYFCNTLLNCYETALLLQSVLVWRVIFVLFIKALFLNVDRRLK